MQSKSALHGPAMFMANSGFILPGFPSMGAWVTYGLGSENENLPAFVVLPDPRGLPPGGVINWGAGFLPAIHQATTIATDDSRPPIADLFPPREFAHQPLGLFILDAEAHGRGSFLEFFSRILEMPQAAFPCNVSMLTVVPASISAALASTSFTICATIASSST